MQLFTVIWLWRETMFTMFCKVHGIPQIDDQLQACECQEILLHEIN